MTDAPESMVSVDDATATFRELREYAGGRLDTEHHDIHPIAGLVEDDEIRQVLMFLADIYEPVDGMPHSFWETDLARQTVRQHATDLATDAIADGNLTQASFISGLPGYSNDVSGMHAVSQLAEWLVHSEQCKLIYVAALMGRGKTDLCLTFYEIIHDHFERVRQSLSQLGLDSALDALPDPEFAANFHVDPGATEIDVQLIDNYDDLVEWMREGDSSMERWFIFDEASTELTAQSGKNAQKVIERMGSLVKKMRKMGVNLIVIGHDKQDVHVAIRSLCSFVSKASLKTASVYAGIKKREPTGHLFDVDGIPPTNLDFDTDDTAEWDWCEDEEGESLVDIEDHPEWTQYRNQKIADIRSMTDENGDPLIGQEDLGKAFGLSASTVSRAEREAES